MKDRLQFLKYKKGLRVYESFSADWVKLFIKEAKALKVKNAERLNFKELTLVYVSKAKIKTMNSQYRGKSKPTDILSFSGDGVFSLGDLVICLDVVKEKAKVSNLSQKLYLQLLISHGILHLLDYDHERSLEEDQLMFSIQNKIIKRVAKKLAPEAKSDFDIDY